VLSGVMSSMGRTLEKLGPALYSPKCVEGAFCELRIDGVLRRSGGFVLWSIYTPLKQEYTAFVAWLRDRCVKAQDSYLPSYRRRARYLQATKSQ
jgi:hypothetical protein